VVAVVSVTCNKATVYASSKTTAAQTAGNLSCPGSSCRAEPTKIAVEVAQATPACHVQGNPHGYKRQCDQCVSRLHVGSRAGARPAPSSLP